MSWIITKDKYLPFLSTPSSKWRERGNHSFTQRRFDDSIFEYTIALMMATHETERPSLLSNRSAAFLELGCFQNALADAQESIQIDPKWWKGYLRCACALVGLNRKEEAIRMLKSGVSCTSGEGLHNLEQKIRESASNLSNLLKTLPNEDPVMISSPNPGGAVALLAGPIRSKQCSLLFEWVEQGNVEMIKEIINSKNIKDPMYPQSVLLVDSATGQTALHIAAANIRHHINQSEMIWTLLEAGLQPETLDKLGHSPITLAAISGNTLGMCILLEKLISQPADSIKAQTALIGCDDLNGFDVLVHAILANQKESVSSLLSDYGCTSIIEHRYCSQERSVLHLAAVNGSHFSFEVLFKLAFDEMPALCNSTDSRGFSPLAYASAHCTRRHFRDGKLPQPFSGLFRFDSLQVPIEGLCQGGSNVLKCHSLSNDSKSWSTLKSDPRCTSGDSDECIHTPFVRDLIETGLVDVNQLQGDEQVSCLFIASLFGHYPVVRVLLENGARQDVGTATPMQAACSGSFTQVCHLLATYHTSIKNPFIVAENRKPCFTSKVDDSPLTLLICNFAPISEIHFLLSQTDYEITGTDLQVAILTKHIPYVQILLEYGAKSSLYTEFYGTLTGLATAVDVNCLPIFKMMLDTSSISHDIDPYGRNILHHVCEYGKRDALLMLLEELDEHYKHETVRREVLTRMLRPASKLPPGRATPLELAARSEHPNCFRILQSHLSESGFTKAELLTGQITSSQKTSAKSSAAVTVPAKSKSISNSEESKPAAANVSNTGATPQMYQAGKVSSNDLTIPRRVPSAPSTNQLYQQHQDYQQSKITFKSTETWVDNLKSLSDAELRSKLSRLLEKLRKDKDAYYLTVLHYAQQDTRVCSILYSLNVVIVCLVMALETNDKKILEGLMRTMALLHRSPSPFIDETVFKIFLKLFDKPLFMETPKAQAYLMVTINNECAAHPKVSPVIVTTLSGNTSYLVKFFDCCLATVKDDEASPAGIGLLDLFTHVFLNDDAFDSTYNHIITTLGESNVALSKIVGSLNNSINKVIDMTASLRMLKRISHRYPTNLLLAGCALPLLRICSQSPNEMNTALIVSAFTTFSDFLRFTNRREMQLLWNLMSHSMFLEIGLSSNSLDLRTAACDAIVCLCRDEVIQAELIRDDKYIELLLDMFELLIPVVLPPDKIKDLDALAIRECLIALTFLWNKDASRITALLDIPHAFDMLLALYHSPGISQIADRIIQFMWAYSPERCQALLKSTTTSQFYQAYVESSKFDNSPANFNALLETAPFAPPKWYTQAEGVIHVEMEGISCDYCGIGSAIKDLLTCSECKSAKYCSRECQRADWRRHRSLVHSRS